MKSNNPRVFTGILLFVGIIGVGAVLYNFVQLYLSMPSKNDVVNFASDAWGQVPSLNDVVDGSLVPDNTETQNPDTGSVNTLPTSETEPTTSTSADWLTPSQRQTLSALGIDESDLPATLTPELEACFVTKIGVERVSAIKGGDTPTVIEGMKAVTCL